MFHLIEGHYLASAELRPENKAAYDEDEKPSKAETDDVILHRPPHEERERSGDEASYKQARDEISTEDEDKSDSTHPGDLEVFYDMGDDGHGHHSENGDIGEPDISTSPLPPPIPTSTRPSVIREEGDPTAPMRSASIHQPPPRRSMPPPPPATPLAAEHTEYTSHAGSPGRFSQPVSRPTEEPDSESVISPQRMAMPPPPRSIPHLPEEEATQEPETDFAISTRPRRSLPPPPPPPPTQAAMSVPSHEDTSNTEEIAAAGGPEDTMEEEEEEEEPLPILPPRRVPPPTHMPSSEDGPPPPIFISSARATISTEENEQSLNSASSISPRRPLPPPNPRSRVPEPAPSQESLARSALPSLLVPQREILDESLGGQSSFELTLARLSLIIHSQILLIRHSIVLVAEALPRPQTILSILFRRLFILTSV